MLLFMFTCFITALKIKEKKKDMHLSPASRPCQALCLQAGLPSHTPLPASVTHDFCEQLSALALLLPATPVLNIPRPPCAASSLCLSHVFQRS